MRIALISDVHSNFHALEAVLADIARRGVDRIICLGDVTLKGPLPKECVDRVRDLKCPVVLGNADGSYHPDFQPERFTPRNRSQAAIQADFPRHMAALTEDDRVWLQNFPISLTELWEGVQMEFFHATPTHNYRILMPWVPNEELAALRSSEQTAISAYGHCHRPFIRFMQGFQVINSGSVGIPFDGDPRPSYALLEVKRDVTTATVLRVPYDAEAAIKAAQDAGMQGWELFAHTARTGQFPG
ncbi:MAG TPA: metallophosphoesterase family protein [Symbiobacteriaceae bacterium]|jgi:putative phosphoesterase